MTRTARTIRRLRGLASAALAAFLVVVGRLRGVLGAAFLAVALALVSLIGATVPAVASVLNPRTCEVYGHFGNWRAFYYYNNNPTGTGPRRYRYNTAVSDCNHYVF
jgi:hypothetical protein